MKAPSSVGQRQPAAAATSLAPPLPAHQAGSTHTSVIAHGHGTDSTIEPQQQQAASGSATAAATAAAATSPAAGRSIGSSLPFMPHLHHNSLFIRDSQLDTSRQSSVVSIQLGQLRRASALMQAMQEQPPAGALAGEPSREALSVVLSSLAATASFPGHGNDSDDDYGDEDDDDASDHGNPACDRSIQGAWCASNEEWDDACTHGVEDEQDSACERGSGADGAFENAGVQESDVGLSVLGEGGLGANPSTGTSPQPQPSPTSMQKLAAQTRVWESQHLQQQAGGSLQDQQQHQHRQQGGGDDGGAVGRDSSTPAPPLTPLPRAATSRRVMFAAQDSRVFYRPSPLSHDHDHDHSCDYDDRYHRPPTPHPRRGSATAATAAVLPDDLAALKKLPLDVRRSLRREYGARRMRGVRSVADVAKWLVPEGRGRYWALWTWAYLLVAFTAFANMAGQYSLYRITADGQEDDAQGTLSSDAVEAVGAAGDPGPEELWSWLVFWRQGDNRSFDFDYLLLWGGRWGPAVAGGQHWRWLSPLLIHASSSHLLSNGLAFLITSGHLEANYGALKVAGAWLVAGVAGQFCSAAFEDPCKMVVGCSGAVCGLLGLFTADVVMNHEVMHRPWIRLLAAIGGVLFIIITQAVDTSLDGAVSHVSHGCGFLAGLSIALLTLPNLRSKRWRAVKKLAARIKAAARASVSSSGRSGRHADARGITAPGDLEQGRPFSEAGSVPASPCCSPDASRRGPVIVATASASYQPLAGADVSSNAGSPAEKLSASPSSPLAAAQELAQSSPHLQQQASAPFQAPKAAASSCWRATCGLTCLPLGRMDTCCGLNHQRQFEPHQPPQQPRVTSSGTSDCGGGRSLLRFFSLGLLRPATTSSLPANQHSNTDGSHGRAVLPGSTSGQWQYDSIASLPSPSASSCITTVSTSTMYTADQSDVAFDYDNTCWLDVRFLWLAMKVTAALVLVAQLVAAPAYVYRGVLRDLQC